MKDNQPIDSLRVTGPVYPEPASHDELLSALEAAKSGHSPESARALMAEMLRQLKSGSKTIGPYVENWAIHAFTKILEENWKADQAFGLLARQGQHERPDTHDRDLIATATVILEMRSGMTWREAIGDAANRLFEDGSGDKAVEAAYAKHHQTLGLLPTNTLAAIVPR